VRANISRSGGASFSDVSKTGGSAYYQITDPHGDNVTWASSTALVGTQPSIPGATRRTRRLGQRRRSASRAPSAHGPMRPAAWSAWACAGTRMTPQSDRNCRWAIQPVQPALAPSALISMRKGYSPLRSRSPAFTGAYMLGIRSTGEGQCFSFWESKDALEPSRPAVNALRSELAAEEGDGSTFAAQHGNWPDMATPILMPGSPRCPVRPTRRPPLHRRGSLIWTCASRARP
jgi:hypothetical protein